MTEVGKKIVEGLKQFADDLEKGQVDKYRRTKVVKMDDGTFKRVVEPGSKADKV